MSRYTGPAGQRIRQLIAIPRPDNSPGIVLRERVSNPLLELEEVRATHPKAALFRVVENYFAEGA